MTAIYERFEPDAKYIDQRAREDDKAMVIKYRAAWLIDYFETLKGKNPASIERAQMLLGEAVTLAIGVIREPVR